MPKQNIRGNTACARACSLSKQSGERKAKTSQHKATPWELFATNIRPEWAKELLFRSLPLPLCSGGLSFFCPLRGRIHAASNSPGAARGWHINAPSGRKPDKRTGYPLLYLTEGQKNIIPPPFGRAGVGFTSPPTSFFDKRSDFVDYPSEARLPVAFPQGRGIATVTSKEQFRRICYPPESNIRIFNPQYPATQPRLKSADKYK